MPFSPDEYVTDPMLKVLIDADALLSDESKWRKHLFRKGDDRRCLVRALIDACPSQFHLSHVIDFVEEAVGVEQLTTFNDDPATEFPDIKALFAKAIAAQRATGEAVYPGVGS